MFVAHSGGGEHFLSEELLAEHSHLLEVGLGRFFLGEGELAHELVSVEPLESSEESLVHDVFANAELDSIFLLHEGIMALNVFGVVLGFVVGAGLLLSFVVGCFVQFLGRHNWLD